MLGGTVTARNVTINLATAEGINIGDNTDVRLDNVTVVKPGTNGVAINGGNLTVTVETAADEEFGEPVELATSGAIAAADLVAGYTFPINFIPKGNLGYRRLKYTVSGTATAGKITAGVVAANGGGFHEA